MGTLRYVYLHQYFVPSHNFSRRNEYFCCGLTVVYSINILEGYFHCTEVVICLPESTTIKYSPFMRYGVHLRKDLIFIQFLHYWMFYGTASHGESPNGISIDDHFSTSKLRSFCLPKHHECTQIAIALGQGEYISMTSYEKCFHTQILILCAKYAIDKQQTTDE